METTLIDLAEILERDGDEHHVGAKLRDLAASIAAGSFAESAHSPASNGCTEPCDALLEGGHCACGAWHGKPKPAAKPMLPSGWSVRKDGDEIRVTAPNGIPGGMTLSLAAIDGLVWNEDMHGLYDNDPLLPSQLLYALCDALLTPPHEDPELSALVEKGTRAWSGVPDGWLENLRGNADRLATVTAAPGCPQPSGDDASEP